MKATSLTLTRDDAVNIAARTHRRRQIYMYQFDVDVVFRKGRTDDEQISKVRYREDTRPQQTVNQQTGIARDKVNDVVTFKMPNKDDLYVLAKSGGVSLFDGMSSKVSLGKKDCWWVIRKEAKLPEGLVIAKDIFPGPDGLTHYAVEAERDMLLSEFVAKLETLKQYMSRVA